MSHRTVIINRVAPLFTEAAVRAELTAEQCSCADAIIQSNEPTPREFRELTHLLNRAYSKED